MSIDTRDIPQFLKWTMLFIDRVGFPIMAFLLMCAYAFFSMEKLTKAVTQITITLQQVSTHALNDHQGIKRQIRELDVPRRAVADD